MLAIDIKSGSVEPEVWTKRGTAILLALAELGGGGDVYDEAQRTATVGFGACRELGAAPEGVRREGIGGL